MSKMKKPPSRIDEHDRAIIALSAERSLRLQLQHEAAVKHANELKAHREAHAQKHTAAVAELRRRYALGDADTVDLESGTINRAPVELAASQAAAREAAVAEEPPKGKK